MKPKKKHNGLSRKKRAYLRGKLLERRRQLLEGLDRTLSEPRPAREGVPPEEGDWASEEESWSTELGAATIASATLADVEHALTKLAHGAFGTCEECGRRIPEARLRVVPFARLCVKCKREDERRQTGGGASAYGWGATWREPEEPEWSERTVQR